MGLLKSDIELLSYVISKNNKIIRGNVLSISQLAVYGNLQQVKNILGKFSLKNITIPKDFDTKNKIKSWIGTKQKNNINIKTLLKLFGAKNTTVCDFSSYESPDVTIDLNYKVNNSHINKYDLILDFGTLEHIFDVPQALENYIRMTKKNGHIIICSPCSNMIDHSFYMFSPTLFFDYFKNNGFEIYKCFLKTRSPYYPYNRTKFYEYLFQGNEIPILPNKSTEIIIFAKKIKTLKNILKPNQFIYTSNPEWENSKKSKNGNKPNNKNINFIFKEIVKKLIMSKLTPFFIQKIFFSIYRGKNLKKLYL